MGSKLNEPPEQRHGESRTDPLPRLELPPQRCFKTGGKILEWHAPFIMLPLKEIHFKIIKR